ncbi:MAG: hypothetical protein M3R13_06695 [Armatimonadota bacterium]|nr:hypothetical protein [Armatimonadota bacterium]
MIVTGGNVIGPPDDVGELVDAIRDRSTIEDSKAFAVGVEHVLVNGVLVLEIERMTGARPGVAWKRRSK